jgi:hypothetical protein
LILFAIFAGNPVFATNSNVGIGTATPASNLEVKGVNPAIMVTDTQTSGNVLLLQAYTPTSGPFIAGHTDGAGNSTANTPSERIQVGNNGLRIQRSGATAVGSPRAWSDSLVIDNSGNVGIGTSSPASPLTVAGMIESTSGGVKFPDGTTQVTAASSSLASLPSGTTAGYCSRGAGCIQAASATAPATYAAGVCGCAAGWTSKLTGSYVSSGGCSGTDVFYTCIKN